MRVLVVATSPAFTVGTRLLVTLAAGLASRGEVVALATSLKSDTEAAVERTWPRLSVRSVSGTGWFRQAMSLRGIVTALRPDAMLVGSEHDAVLAAFAAGKNAPIVRRLAAEERIAAGEMAEENEELPWRARFALSRARIARWGEREVVVSWPVGASNDGAVLPLSSEPSTEQPHIALVPAPTHDEETAAALRAIAHLRTRHPSLQLLLIGDASALQNTRLHAAALGMSSCVHVTPTDRLLHHELTQLSATWIARFDDTGAVAAIVSMQQRVPVITSPPAPFASLVNHGVSGIIIPSDGGAASISELARLIGDSTTRLQMGQAAYAKASTEHDWNAFVDEAATLLARAAGVSLTRVTRRPSLTPA